ncbi:MAG TPA: DUF4013 domain-containing protein [Thermoanaerobaculia bacterium]|nr:DUF4013 domain-containing protein [Thermoanaerobaculia bacterium]
MSEVPVASAPPPPPPPPPPAAPASTSGFDFGKPFTYVFDDPRWLQKILVGGLFILASVFLIGWFFVLGYLARVARNIIAGHEYPLPEWEDLGGMFNEGARLIGVLLCYAIPMFLIAMVFMVPAILSDTTDNEAVQAISGSFAGCLSCLIVPLVFVILFFMPASLIFAVVEQRFGAAFEIGRLWAFIRANIGNYLLAIVVAIVARILGGFGIFLLCVGVIFTLFWSFLVMTHGFAQAYRFRKVS